MSGRGSTIYFEDLSVFQCVLLGCAAIGSLGAALTVGSGDSLGPLNRAGLDTFALLIFAVICVRIAILVMEALSNVGDDAAGLLALLFFIPHLALERWPFLRKICDVALIVSAYYLLYLLFSETRVGGGVSTWFWWLLTVAWLLGWYGMERLSKLKPRSRTVARAIGIAIPLLFGLWLLILWEIVVLAAAVPAVLLPPPSAIWQRIVSSVPTLAADFRQTFLKAVLIGYAIGCLSGFLTAILVDRVPFLRRGLLPVGNLVSALPVVGIAPILVMWFGFDWPSKAAVVVVMTFFPMLVNTVAGLAAAGSMERDLMRTYAANYFQALVKLRLPAALPFVFNALKINSTLALIGAIVAEFFGTPIVGMGFRISTEVGRMAIDMVWAEIAVAALAGSLFYGLVSLVERMFTFWHPSYRT